MTTKPDVLDLDVVADDEEVTPNDGLAHYVKARALIEGGPVTALCGKRYVPVTLLVHDKETCPKCKELIELLDVD